MKPLPAQNPVPAKAAESPMPSLPSAPASYSKSNRRAPANHGQRAYPWLLCVSTLLSAGFCLAYVTKPVILASQKSASPFDPAETPSAVSHPAAGGSAAAHPDLMPGRDRLPGETTPGGPLATASPGAPPSPNTAGPYEQTNLRIQHILTAEAPGGHVAKIDLDVPVLYQSRGLRWSAAEVAQARELLARLADYQEKSQVLRTEGTELLDSWNRLVGGSIPAAALRADSPTLPANQKDAADLPRPARLDTTELIKIQPAGK